MDVESIVELWARWRIDRHPGEWPSITVLGKILDGLPSLKCIVCNGRGRKPLEGGQTEECQTCHGNGRVKADPGGVKANPAFIRSTKPGGYVEDDDLMQKVDRIVCTVLTDTQRAVVMHEYCGGRNRNDALKTLKLNHHQFRMLLLMSMRLIEESLRGHAPK